MRVITYNVWAGVWWKPDIFYDKKRKTKLFATLSQLIDEDAEVLIALQEIWTKKLAYTLKHNYRSTHHTLFTTKESSHMPLGVFLYGLALALLPGIVAGVLVAVQVPGWVLALSVGVVAVLWWWKVKESMFGRACMGNVDGGLIVMVPRGQHERGWDEQWEEQRCKKTVVLKTTGLNRDIADYVRPRTFLYIKCAFLNSKIPSIINIHMGLIREDKKRTGAVNWNGQFTQLCTYISKMRSGPDFVVGDFNVEELKQQDTHVKSGAYKEVPIWGSNEESQNNPFEDGTYIENNSNMPMPTWVPLSTSNVIRNKNAAAQKTFPSRNSRIDHVFIHKDKMAEWSAPTLVGNTDDIPLSDHYGLSVTAITSKPRFVF